MAFAHRLSRLAGKGVVDIRILSKAPPERSNSHAAQGGVAVVIDPADSWERHRDDTLSVGAGRSDPRVVEMVVREGPECIRELLAFGARFDADPDGNLNAAREGGHSAARVVHHSDHTGKELVRVLQDQVLSSEAITLEVPMHALDLLIEGTGEQRRCHGLRVLDLATGAVSERYADVVVLATGGIGEVYMHTTNPIGATGSGIAMAVRAGVELRGMAFVQFHPTALFTRDPGTAFLISEAVRGAGAVLRRSDGTRLMTGVHPLGDLAPRNVVARAIHAEMRASGSPHVWLDARPIGGERSAKEFPMIHARCIAEGIDPATSPIPVMPAAHYLCGGIRTGLHGNTSLNGLYALGECASSGLHGADRLASNSLLEALVIPRRAAASVLVTGWPTHLRKDVGPAPTPSVESNAGHASALLELRQTMTEHLAIVRDHDGLRKASLIISGINDRAQADWASGARSPELLLLRDLANVAHSISRAAMAEESNAGTHFNVDLDPHSIPEQTREPLAV